MNSDEDFETIFCREAITTNRFPEELSLQQMQAMREILQTLAVVILCILGLIVGLYMVLLFIDRWLKFRSGGREQEGLSNLLVEAYKRQKEQQRPDDDGRDEFIPPEK